MDRLIFCIFISTLVSSCIPQMETVDHQDQQVNAEDFESSAIYQQLSTTYTGQQTLNDVNNLKNSGYTLTLQRLSLSEIQAQNGHTGGGFTISGTAITIFINNSLTGSELTHAFAHEVSHAKDDIEVYNFLEQRTYIKTAAEDFVSRYNIGLNNFDSRTIQYVLGTLFCSEVRAYNKNQRLADEGLQTSQFAHGSSLPQYIDEHYIYRFGTHYGSNASAMASWCLSKSSMNEIQNLLGW